MMFRMASVVKLIKNIILCLTMTAFTSLAYAEYYVVAAGCGQGRCCKPRVPRCSYRPVHRCNKCSVHRCSNRCRRPSPIISVYYMVPAGPCDGYRSMGNCNSAMNGFFPTPWETYNYSLMYNQPSPVYITPDPDLATGDDNAFFYPEMNIDG